MNLTRDVEPTDSRCPASEAVADCGPARAAPSRQGQERLSECSSLGGPHSKRSAFALAPERRSSGRAPGGRRTGAPCGRTTSSGGRRGSGGRRAVAGRSGVNGRRVRQGGAREASGGEGAKRGGRRARRTPGEPAVGFAAGRCPLGRINDPGQGIRRSAGLDGRGGGKRREPLHNAELRRHGLGEPPGHVGDTGGLPHFRGRCGGGRRRRGPVRDLQDVADI